MDSMNMENWYTFWNVCNYIQRKNPNYAPTRTFQEALEVIGTGNIRETVQKFFMWSDKEEESNE